MLWHHASLEGLQACRAFLYRPCTVPVLCRLPDPYLLVSLVAKLFLSTACPANLCTDALQRDNAHNTSVLKHVRTCPMPFQQIQLCSFHDCAPVTPVCSVLAGTFYQQAPKRQDPKAHQQG